MLRVQHDRATSLLGHLDQARKDGPSLWAAIHRQGAKEISGYPEGEGLGVLRRHPIEPGPERMLAATDAGRLPVRVDVDDGHAKRITLLHLEKLGRAVIE